MTIYEVSREKQWFSDNFSDENCLIASFLKKWLLSILTVAELNEVYHEISEKYRKPAPANLTKKLLFSIAHVTATEYLRHKKEELYYQNTKELQEWLPYYGTHQLIQGSESKENIELILKKSTLSAQEKISLENKHVFFALKAKEQRVIPASS